jgi:hypothetical protein
MIRLSFCAQPVTNHARFQYSVIARQAHIFPPADMAPACLCAPRRDPHDQEPATSASIIKKTRPVAATIAQNNTGCSSTVTQSHGKGRRRLLINIVSRAASANEADSHNSLIHNGIIAALLATAA